MGDTFSVNLASAGIGPAGNFTFNFQPTITLKGKWSAYLSRYSIWNTVPNISAANKTNYISIDIGTGSFQLFQLPAGTFQISDINTYLKQQIAAAGGSATSFTISTLAGFVQITLGPNYRINLLSGYSTTNPVLGSGNLYIIFGFSPAIYDGTGGGAIFSGSVPGNITLGFTSFRFEFPGLVGNSIGLPADSPIGQSTPCLYTDAWQIPPNTLQTVVISNPLPLPVICESFNSISVQITDQTGNILDFNQGGSTYNNDSSLSIQFTKISDK